MDVGCLDQDDRAPPLACKAEPTAHACWSGELISGVDLGMNRIAGAEDDVVRTCRSLAKSRAPESFVHPSEV